MKILFTDLDSTFLNDEKEVPVENAEAVKRMLEQGHKVVIATGRALPSAMKQAKKLGLNQPGCFCIAYNGAVIYDFAQEKCIYKKEVPVECAREIYRICKSYDTHVQTYNDEVVLSPSDNMEVKEYCRLVSMDFRLVPDVFETLETDPPKVLVIDFSCSGKLNMIQGEVDAMGEGRIDTFYSCPQLLEIVAHGVSKGEAIRKLCDYLNVSLEDTVACGDAENDISMIECAGVGVCMCNGDSRVKEKADYITTLNNNQGGVAEVIKKFILEA